MKTGFRGVAVCNKCSTSPTEKSCPIYDWNCYRASVPESLKMTLKKNLTLEITNAFEEIFKRYESKADTKEVREGDFHLFLSIPPRYSPPEIVQWTRTILAIKKSKQSFEMETSLWAMKPEAVGVLGPQVRNKVTSSVICGLINYR